MKMKNLKDLFELQLKDLYNVEIQLIETLPRLVENAEDDKLKEAFENHLEETRGHKKRIEEICNTLNIDPGGKESKAMKGMIEEVESFLKQDIERGAKNAGLIAEAQRVEHYEISGYGTAATYAKELGHKDIASKLKQTLDEEYRADDLLTEMAKQRVNRQAKE